MSSAAKLGERSAPYGSWPTSLTSVLLVKAAVRELSFYAQIFGFDIPAEEGTIPIEIHLPTRGG